MAKKTTPKKPESKRAEQRAISKDAIRALCILKSDERLDAARTHAKASDAFFKEATEHDKRHKDIQEAYEQAEADAKAHEDYLKAGGPVERGEMSRKEYDEDHRALVDAAKAAEQQRDESRQQAQTALGPLRKTIQDAEKSIADLTRQWAFHEKRAKEAGVDVRDLWQPGQPIPTEEEA